MIDGAGLGELLAQPPKPFKSVRAVMSVTVDSRAYRDAELRSRRRLRQLVRFAGAGVYSGPRERRTDDVWFEPPRRLRVATDGAATVLCDGSRAWIRDRFESIWTATPPANALRMVNLAALRPSVVLDGLVVEPVEKVELLGLPGVRAHARHGAAPPGWHDDGGLSPHADDYELVVDAERRIILRAIARARGKVIASTEIVEITFDEVFSPALFTPGAGDEVRSIEVLFDHRLENLTLSETSSRVQFPVWALERIPESWTIQAGYWPPLVEWFWPPRIALIYSSSDGDVFVSILEAPAAEDTAQGDGDQHGTVGWNAVHYDGERYCVASDPSTGEKIITFTRGATSIRITAEGLRERELLEMAASMRDISAEGRTER
jgi:hypothetical protein